MVRIIDKDGTCAEEEDNILEFALRAMERSTDEFISSCLDEQGKIKAPDRRAIMRIRGMLPKWCKNTLIK